MDSTSTKVVVCKSRFLEIGRLVWLEVALQSMDKDVVAEQIC